MHKKNTWPCLGRPETLKGQPIGMYHCEFCGEMQLAGEMHLPPQFPSQWEEPFPKVEEPVDQPPEQSRLTTEQREVVKMIIDYKDRTGAWLEAAALRTLLHIAESSPAARTWALPPRKEFDAERHDLMKSGDRRFEDACEDPLESSDYVDGWNDALDAVESARKIQ